MHILLQTLFSSIMITTFVFVLSLIALRFFVVRWIRNADSKWGAEQRLRVIGYTRTFFFAVLVIGFLYIWQERVQNLAFSLYAIAFAIVFSVKELLQCVSGSIVRIRGTSYDLGDRISIKGMKGDVIDINLLSTTLLEVGPGEGAHQYTGKKITMPNSLLISEQVFNESFLENFYLHNIKIPLMLHENWEKAKKILLEIASAECAPYMEQARRQLREVEKKHSVQMPSVDPRVWIELPAPERLSLHLRFPSPSRMKDRLEQAILIKFLQKFSAKEEEVSVEKEEKNPA